MITTDPTALPEVLVARLSREQLADYLSDLMTTAKAVMILTRGFHVASLEELRRELLGNAPGSAQVRYVRDGRPTVDTILRRGEEFELVRA